MTHKNTPKLFFGNTAILIAYSLVSGGARTSRQPGHFQVSAVVRQVIRGLYFVANKFKSKITNHIYLFQKLV